MEELIKMNFSGQLVRILLIMSTAVINRSLIYAHLIDESMKGMGTDEKKLSFWIARCREPALMGAIKSAYASLYKKSLESKIKGEVSGDYEKLLVAIVDRGKDCR